MTKTKDKSRNARKVSVHVRFHSGDHKMIADYCAEIGATVTGFVRRAAINAVLVKKSGVRK